MREKVLEFLRKADGYASGEDIGLKLGISRAAVWKILRRLRDDGYVIQAANKKGYRLISEPDTITAEGITAHLKTKWAGRDIAVSDNVDSTNNEVKRRADEMPEGFLVVSESQSAGKGRRGRTWESDRGMGIFMSLLLKPDIEPGRASMITLVAAMAVRSAIENICGVDACIKWPNDIIYGEKKLCGILTEMSAQIDCVDYVVVGMGINVRNADFLQDIADKATSLYMITGEIVSREMLIAEIMNRMEYYYTIYKKTKDLRGLAYEYNDHLINRGRMVKLLDDKCVRSGTAVGINDKGELEIQTNERTVFISSGEVSVRGIHGYI